MKKFAFLFVAVATVFTSCSDDNDSKSAKLPGTWEFAKQGSVVGGQEVLVDYDHTAGCPKDYIVIDADKFVEHDFTGDDCLESTDTTTYTRSGNTITITSGGETVTGTIMQLTSSTLKLKTSTTFEGTTYDFITVLTRK